MSPLDHFHVVDGYAVYRPVGTVVLQEAIELVGGAIRIARQRKIARLLVDVTGLEGFDPPDVLDRFSLAERFARDAESSVMVAMVVKPAFVDPEHFGITVARNRGLVAEVFSSEADAIAWLLDPKNG